MALKKKITASNGIVLEYHRVALINIEVNQQNTYLVHSYLHADGRQIEKDYASGLYLDEEANMHFPYVNYQYIHTPYDGTMTIEKVYEYLKTLPQFEGAEDV